MYFRAALVQGMKPELTKEGEEIPVREKQRFPTSISSEYKFDFLDSNKFVK
jgi:hypothetical protein